MAGAGSNGQACLSVGIDGRALGQMRDFVLSFAAGNRLCPDDATRAMVMLEELLTNLEKYGGASDRSAKITLAVADRRFTIEFRDDGQPFDPLGQPPPSLDGPLEDRGIGGLGLLLLRELSHESSYRRIDGQNVVRLVRRI
jgi:anti-sigma regulatory factor (Ser/Thr protein kinase)